MSIRHIVLYPHKALTTAAQPIESFDDQLHQLVDDLAETMYNAHGIGIAANQIDVLQRVTVIDTGKENGPGLLELINPRVVESEGSTKSSEGCLSFPQLTVDVKRASEVAVEYQDRDGQEQRIEASGLLAIALQHEIDHLDGIVFTERIGPIKKKLALKKYRKLLEEQANA